MDFQLGKQLFQTLYSCINGYSISTQARDKIGQSSKEYTYGEVIPESFYQMILKVSPKKGEVFYDLGSGIGKAVVLASLFFEFSKCLGIEKLEDLYKASKDILTRFNHDRTIIKFIHSDFLEYDLSDGDIFFVHSTCFPDKLMRELQTKLESIKKGARIITVTKTLDSDLFQPIESKDYRMSWGKATIHFYTKIK